MLRTHDFSVTVDEPGVSVARCAPGSRGNRRVNMVPLPGVEAAVIVPPLYANGWIGLEDNSILFSLSNLEWEDAMHDDIRVQLGPFEGAAGQMREQ